MGYRVIEDFMGYRVSCKGRQQDGRRSLWELPLNA
jgi:hypothetical protein